MQSAIALLWISLSALCLRLVREATASAHGAAERKLMRSMTATSHQSATEGKALRPLHYVDHPPNVDVQPINVEPPLNKPFAETYSGMILGDTAAFYLEFQDNADDSSDNYVSTTIIGAGKYVNCEGKEAGHFGKDMYRVNVQSVLPINLEQHGYHERTIEMWFRAAALPGPFGAWAQNLTLYEEGANDTGIHIFVGCCENETTATLYMFMWNHAATHGTELYGTADVDPEPITCTFAKDEPHYVAFVFDGNNISDDGNYTPHYSAYMGWPSGSEGVKLCGSKQMGVSAEKNNTWRSNIKLPWHEGPVGVGGINGDALFGANRTCKSKCDVHNFNGIIDEFAIYNAALTDDQLESHFDAGKHGEVCLPADVIPE